ncbi:MAG: hypothetical protein C4574_03010 [Candidatus Latescibacterota bacterium]|nr:MAG: hypothetical protein C4574_03010 [Candidatus Latescibacterota bacterium]
MNALSAAALAVAFARAAASPGGGLAASGAVYFERGHYWIEIAFRDGAGRDTIPPDLDPSRFEITRIGDDSGFKPTRIEAIRGSGTSPSVILSTSRIEGRACYRVVFTPLQGPRAAVDSICDPFALEAGAREWRSKTFFRRYVASAFHMEGGESGLNQLAYGYDFSNERAAARLRLAPRVRARGWTAEASVKRDETSYTPASGGRTAAVRASLSASLSRAVWASDLRCAIAAAYGADRTTLERASGDSTVRSRSASVEGRVRFDNLLDPANRFPASVFAGVEASFGWAWYLAEGDGPLGGRRSGRLAPFAGIRASWTVLYGFRLSYSLQSFWPASGGETFAAFHSARMRMLLGDVLARRSERAYHPDVEAVWESGRRPPFLEREERISIGFIYDLYPW